MSEEVVNLDNCAREPIHIPGAIQPHGLLFVLRESDLTIVQVSENVQEILGFPVEHYRNQPLTVLLNAEQLERVQFALDTVEAHDANPVDLQVPAADDSLALDGFVHRHDGFAILELEPASPAFASRFLQFYKTVTKVTSKLHAMSTLASMLSEAVLGLREITGFDRVMIYRFAENGEGEVVAEAKGEAGVPFQGLWYPASDIPEQARRLYVLNPVRAIPTCNYVPAQLVPALNPDTRRPVDLSFAGLRSVSPIHCEYLRNMGVEASMSVSILRDGRLWGLVSCHHFTAKIVPFEMRKACTFVAEVLSGEIARREAEDESAYQMQATVVQAKFLELMASAPKPLLGLVNGSPNLMDLIPAEGAGIVDGENVRMIGNTPGYDDVLDLVDMLQKQEVASTFVTHSLKNHFPLTESIRSTASGVIALEVGRDPAAYVFFFRPEMPQTVTWGGNPEKPVLASEDGFRLSPRKSFEAWKEEVKGQAARWTAGEVRAASELRNLITVVTYAKGDRA